MEFLFLGQSHVDLINGFGDVLGDALLVFDFR
jgi:hypothetical protein